MNKNNIFMFITMYFLIIGPKLYVIDLFYLSNCIFFTWMTIAYSFRLNKRVSLNLLFILPFFSIYIAAILISNLFNSNELYYVDLIKMLVLLCNAYFVSELYNKKYGSLALYEMYKTISYLGLVTSLISLSMFFNLELKESILSNVDMKMASSMAVKMNLRVTDLSLGGGTNLSLFFLFCSICNIVVIKKSKMPTILQAIMLLVFPVSAFLSSRTGFYFILVVYFIQLFYIRKFNLRFTSILALCLALVSFCFALFVKDNSELFFEKILPWAFEIFYSIGSSGAIESKTTTAIINHHYDLNIPLRSYIVGGGGGYIHSDVSFIRVLANNGVLGLIGFVSCYIMFVASIVFSSNTENGRVYKVSFLLISSFLVIANFKEMIWVNSRGLFFIYICLLFLLLRNRNEVR